MSFLRWTPLALLACSPVESSPATNPSADTGPPAVSVRAGVLAATPVDFDGDGVEALVVATAEGLTSFKVTVDGTTITVRERGTHETTWGGWAVGQLLPWGTGLFVMNADGSQMLVLGNRLDQQWEGVLQKDVPVGSVLAAQMDTDADDDLTLVSADETALVRLRNDDYDGWQVQSSFTGSFTGFRWVAAGPLFGGERDEIVVIGPQLLVTTAREDFNYLLDDVLEDAPQVDAIVGALDDTGPHLISATRRVVTARVGDADAPAMFRQIGQRTDLTRIRDLIRISGPAEDRVGVVHEAGFEVLRGATLQSEGVVPMVDGALAIPLRVDQDASAVVLQLDPVSGDLSLLTP